MEVNANYLAYPSLEPTGVSSVRGGTEVVSAFSTQLYCIV